jgi:regulator of protease activity HflC (stomatin/prohibitin superfamily)
MEMIISYIGAVFLVLLTGLLFVGGLFRSVTVYEYERGLRYRKGRFEGIVDPGRYRLPPHTEVIKVDVRPAYKVVSGQEVLSADSISVKASVTARYEITDLVKAVNGVQSYEQALYLELQVALREVIGSVTMEEVLGGRAGLGKSLLQIASGPASEFGIRLDSVEIRDIMFPGVLKQTFAQVAEARQEGLAALERARGESAALRVMANAARLIDKSPGLGQLRMLQALSESTGNTLILNLAPDSVPAGALVKGDNINKQ